MIGWYLIGVLGLALLMVVHEGGHFFAARAFGMRVTKFSIGFGPTFFKIVPKDGFFWFTTAADRVRIKLFKHVPEKHGPTIYQVAMIPFLAYVQIAGMNPLEEADPNDKGSYANASLIGRIVTIFGGPLANYVFASFLFFFSFYLGGEAYRPTTVSIIEGRPAAAAGLKDGDKVLEIAGTPVVEWDQMAETISKHPGEAVPIVIERGGERLTLQVTPGSEGGKGKIGVMARGDPMKRPVSSMRALTLAVTTPPEVVKNLVVGLGQYVTGKAEGELAGPKRIVEETAEAAKRGWTDLLYLLGALSAYLGAFNLIPFPALDGGRLMFLGYEATTRRRPNARIEAHIHAIGLVMMLGLMVYVTIFNDFRVGSAK
jgi:regulator of sigma E protease